MRGAPLAALALLVSLAPPLRAQITPVGGTVVDRATGVPVGVAVVSLDGTDARVLTDARGVFRLRAPSPGSWLLRVEGYGYRELSVTLVVSGPRDDLRIELEPLPILLDSLVVGQRRVDVDGRVRDSALDVELMDVEVFVDGALAGVSNAGGRFDLDDLWEGRPTRVTLGAFGYLPVDTVILPSEDLDVEISLVADPLIETMLSTEVERLQERMGGYRTITRPPLDRENLLFWRRLSLWDALGAERMEGRCFFIDEELVPPGLEREMLVPLFPGEVHRVESLFGGEMVRVYTRDFMRRMLSGAVELRHPVYVDRARPPLCR